VALISATKACIWSNVAMSTLIFFFFEMSFAKLPSGCHLAIAANREISLLVFTERALARAMPPLLAIWLRPFPGLLSPLFF